MILQILGIVIGLLAIFLPVGALSQLPRFRRELVERKHRALQAAETGRALADYAATVREQLRREREECNRRQRDLILWNNGIRPSDKDQVFSRRAKRARVHLRAVSDDSLEDSQRCRMMKKVTPP